MATKNIILSIKGDTSGAQKQVEALTNKVNSLVGTLNKAAKASAASQTKLTQAMPTGKSGPLGSIGSALEAGRNKIDSAISGIDAKVKGVQNTFTSWQRGIQSVGDSLRLLSQSISTVGRVMTFLISAPLGLFLKSQAGMAIDFEDGLKRVQKVTGNTVPQMQELSNMMRELAINTSTSHIELLKIAEVVGQMGYTAPDQIAKFTEIINMFAISTDMAAETAALALGRLASAFDFKSLEEINALANVMNALENTNAAFAAQIAKSLGKWAQNAKMLDINADKAAAFTATLIDMGFTEGEAGTALNRLTTGMIQNADAVAAAMSANEKYGSQRAVLNAIEEDAFQVMIDLATAMADGESKAIALAEAMEIGGLRGGRGLAGLSQNLQTLSDNLALSSSQWANASSLIEEYELAMSSTKNQMGLLRNNINDVGITIGDALLPTINQIIMILVPMARLFNEWFKSMDDGTKRLIVLGAVGAVALGPALFMFGQLANALSLVILGFGRMIMLIPQALGALFGLIKPIMMVGSAFLSWPGLVVAAIAGIILVLSQGGDKIAQFFLDLAARATEWGQRLAQTYAGGFIEGAATFIVKAINWVANLIASFFQGHSPPKKGPLSAIDKWGSKVMEAYLNGFKKADFSILSDVGRSIEQWLTRGMEGKGMVKALEKVAEARFNLSKLIDKFNDTGVIDEGMLKKITNGLGPIADNVRDLVRNWLEYNRIQERIAAIEERRKEVKRSYMDEIKGIAGSTMSIKDKVRAIREAQRARDDDLRGLDEEQEKLEEQAAIYKEQMDMQKAMIDAMQTQEDLFQRIVDALESVKESLDGIGDGIGGGFGGIGDLPETEFDLEEAFEEMDTIVSRIQEGKDAFKGFMDAWKGLPNANEIGYGGYGEMYDTLFNIGTKAREIWDTLVGWKDAAMGFIGSLGEGGEIDLASKIKDFDIKDIPFFAGFAEGWETAFKKLENLEAFEILRESFDDLKIAWDALMEAIGGTGLGEGGGIDWEKLGSWIGEALGAIVQLGAAAIGSLLKLGAVLIYAYAKFAIFWQTARDFLQSIPTLASTFLQQLGFIILYGWVQAYEAITAKWEEFKTAWSDLWQTVGERLKAGWWGLVGIISYGWVTAYDWIVGKWEEFKTAWAGFWDTVGTTISTKWDGFKTTLETKWGEFTGSLSTLWETFKTSWGAFWDEVKTTLETKWDALKTAAEEKFGEFVATIEEKALEMQNTVTGYIDGIGAYIEEKSEAIIAWGVQLMQGFIDGIESMGEKVTGAIKGVVEAAIEKVLELLGMASPSKLFEQFGAWTGEGYALGVIGTEGEITQALQAAIVSPANMVGLSAPTNLGSPANATASETHIHFHDPVVRKDTDLDYIIQKVKEALGQQTSGRILMGGQIR